MKSEFPTAQEYSFQKAHYPAMTVVDIRSEQGGITEAYKNHVLLDINKECMRLAVFEGEYRWHRHPDTDELFLVVAGELQIEFEGGAQATLTEWQCMVVPAGTVHRTRAVGRTVNLTFEKQGAQTVFVEPASNQVKVREAYAAQYGDPIAFRRGDLIQVQRADAEFPEWFWCRGPDGKEGWVHHSFLSQSSGSAVAVSDYSAKELTVAAGVQVRMIRVLNGWAFVELDGGEVGWVPERVLETSRSNHDATEPPRAGEG